jgi:hypothetical protein
MARPASELSHRYVAPAVLGHFLGISQEGQVILTLGDRVLIQGDERTLRVHLHKRSMISHDW